MANILKITFLSPAQPDDMLFFKWTTDFGADFLVSEKFKEVRLYPGETVIGSDAESQALNYYNAFLQDYNTVNNWIVTINENVVTIRATNNSVFFDYGIDSEIEFATFEFIPDSTVSGLSGNNMVDYSFIRLKESFAEAKEIGNPKVAEINRAYQVHLIPNEWYLQITNTDFGIVLSGDYQVFLVDSCGVELKDITNTFFIHEFSDIRGLNQIAFEFLINEDFGHDELYLKIVHPYSESIYYSNAFICTQSLSNHTTVYTYRHFGYFNGISYDVFEGFQQIRLNLFFDSVESQTEVSEYYQISTKNTVASRALYKQISRYLSNYMNKFAFERANIMLIHDVIYVDGERITNKPQLQSEERLGNTNLFSATYDAFLSGDDYFEYSPQIFVGLEIIYVSPRGVWTQDTFPYLLQMVFNRDIVDTGVIIAIYKYDDDTLVHTISGSDITIIGTTLQVDIDSPLDNGKYYVLVSSGIKDSVIGSATFPGIFQKDIWTFIIGNGDYAHEDYAGEDYFIN